MNTKKNSIKKDQVHDDNKLNTSAAKMKQKAEPISNWEGEGGAMLPTGEIPMGQELKNLKAKRPIADHNEPEKRKEDEDLPYWQTETPAPGKLAEQTGKSQQPHTKYRDEPKREDKEIRNKRNSALEPDTDVHEEGWSADKMAKESSYDDENTMRARLNAGKANSAKHKA